MELSFTILPYVQNSQGNSKVHYVRCVKIWQIELWATLVSLEKNKQQSNPG